MTATTEARSLITPDQNATGISRTLPVLVVWFLITVWLGLSGALASAGGPPLSLAAAVTVPLLVFAADGWLGRPLFRGLTQLELPALIAIQTLRAGGVFFVVAWMQGELPATFALPAGLGDIAVGVAAPFVAGAVAARRPRARALALGFAVLGLLDLVIAVFLGVTHSSSSFGIFASGITTDRMGRYPFSVIPTFVVPLAVMLHAVALRKLTRPKD